VTLMILGLVVFLGIHLLPMAPALRGAIAVNIGDKPYRGVFSLVSAIGLVLIVVGYRMAPNDMRLFTPLASARATAPVVITLAFVLFAAANMRTHIRATVKHPMLVGLLLWSGVHLASNGDLAGTILFGSFFAYSVVDLASVIRRGAVRPFVPTWKHDAIAVVAGVIAAWLTVRFHGAFFGVPAVT
jgi:uncharacterized membrane protein